MLGFSFVVFDVLLFFQCVDNVDLPELPLILMLQCNDANNFSSSTWKSTQPTDRLAYSSLQLASSALFKGFSHLTLYHSYIIYQHYSSTSLLRWLIFIINFASSFELCSIFAARTILPRHWLKTQDLSRLKRYVLRHHFFYFWHWMLISRTK